MIYQIGRKCKDFEDKTKNNPADFESFADWGSMLMHMSMVSDDQEKKKWYLEQSIDKLEQAISINEDCRSSENELAIFSLGNAFYFKFFLEKDDSVADGYLKYARQKFEIAQQKDPSNSMYASMLEQVYHQSPMLPTEFLLSPLPPQRSFPRSAHLPPHASAGDLAALLPRAPPASGGPRHATASSAPRRRLHQRACELPSCCFLSAARRRGGGDADGAPRAAVRRVRAAEGHARAPAAAGGKD
jgi:hypothetical protein